MRQHLIDTMAQIEERQRSQTPSRRFGMLSDLLGPLEPGLTIGTAGPWLTQRSVLAAFVASLEAEGAVTIEAPLKVGQAVLLQALALRSGVRAERLALGDVPTSAWAGLADASRHLERLDITLVVTAAAEVVVRSAGCVWRLGAPSSLADDIVVEVEAAAGERIDVQSLDGRFAPPAHRRAVLAGVRLVADDATRVLIEERVGLDERSAAESEVSQSACERAFELEGEGISW